MVVGMIVVRMLVLLMFNYIFIGFFIVAVDNSVAVVVIIAVNLLIRI